MREEIISACLEHQDLAYKGFNSKIIGGTKYEIIGVRMPIIQKLAKKVAKFSLQEYHNEVLDIYYEEVLIEGLAIAHSSLSFVEKIPLIEKYCIKIDNWAICDSFVIALKDNSKEYINLIIKFLASPNQYTVRFAIVSLLYHFVDEEHIEDTLHLLDQVNRTEYYIKMAQAWAYTECYCKFPDTSLPHIVNSSMDVWTFNKTIQKITESRLVDNETKIILKQMKRKTK